LLDVSELATRPPTKEDLELRDFAEDVGKMLSTSIQLIEAMAKTPRGPAKIVMLAVYSLAETARRLKKGSGIRPQAPGGTGGTERAGGTGSGPGSGGMLS